MIKQSIIILIICFIPAFVYSQSSIEKVFDYMDYDIQNGKYEEMAEILSELIEIPIDINNDSMEHISKLFILSKYQIDRLIRYRNKFGGFASIYELLFIDGFDDELVSVISPFVSIGKSKNSYKPFYKSKHEIILRLRQNLPKKEGFYSYESKDFKSDKDRIGKQNSRFIGPNFSFMAKYKLNINRDWRVGLVLENDEGEPWFNKYQKMGFDYVSAFTMYEGNKLVKKLIIGDYKVKIGQGLLMWNGFSMGKSSDNIDLEKTDKGIFPSNTTNEFNFMRGAGVSFNIKNMNAVVFASYKKVDGTAINRDSIEDNEIQNVSLYKTGLHRNINEINKKGNIKEFVAGGFIDYNHKHFRLGGQMLFYNYSPNLSSNNNTYGKYKDKGKNRFLTSVDYKTRIGKTYFFGETAFSNTKALATINGIRYTGDNSLSISALYRYYDKKYISSYAYSMGEFSNTSNEEGLYLGMSISPISKLKVNAYYDIFHFFSPRYRSYFPDYGNEISASLKWSESKVNYYFRFKREVRPENLSTGKKNIKKFRKKEEYKFYSDISISELFHTRIKLDYNVYRKASKVENGYMISSDFSYKSSNDRFKSVFRFAYFDTDSYNTRIYGYEHDVLYYFYFPAYFYKGFRTYLNINLKANDRITIYAKMSMTKYLNRDNIGSYTSMIKGNKKYTISIQLRIKI